MALEENQDFNFDKESLKEYTDNLSAFLDTNENEISDQIVEFVEKWVAIQDEKKVLAKKEADMKAHYTRSGVPVSRVLAVVDKMKKKMVQKANEKKEEEEIYNLLLENNLTSSIKDALKN